MAMTRTNKQNKWFETCETRMFSSVCHNYILNNALIGIAAPELGSYEDQKEYNTTRRIRLKSPT